MPIETARLVIRSFTEEDIKQYAAIVAKLEVARFLLNNPPHTFVSLNRKR